MPETVNVNILTAILYGALSFLSPCVLPLVPSYLGYMSGASVQKGVVKAPRTVVLLHALTFVLGFTVVFVLIFSAASELLQALFGYNYKLVLQWVGGLMMIVFGLHFLGVFNIPLLERTIKLNVKTGEQPGYLRSFAVGLGFAAGWTPCVGPFLGALLLQTGQVSAVPLFAAYSIGLGIPFILAALSMGHLTLWLRKITRRTFDLRVAGRTLLRDLNPVSMVSGVLLIFVGVLLISNRILLLNVWFNDWIGPWWPDWLKVI